MSRNHSNVTGRCNLVMVNESRLFLNMNCLGPYAFACGVLGHTNRTCEKLFELDSNDGVRGRDASLKPISHKIGINCC